ncbi:hypothetical protein VNO80_16201 [Phaseolus coccineus]|uniref:GH3 C-terminal domain-containing protein n=1 Tax=Phaseolus coccineus TaxID=3886 RepID=A0AAN9MN27_PHACN
MSYPDTSSVPGHYVLYWKILHCGIKAEVENGNAVVLDGSVLEECCIAVEEQLDYVYRRCHSHDKSVGPLEIRVVDPGTFDALIDLFISQGASMNQYKTPRCIKSKKALKLLNSKVTASFFSPRDPKWENHQHLEILHSETGPSKGWFVDSKPRNQNLHKDSKKGDYLLTGSCDEIAILLDNRYFDKALFVQRVAEICDL